MMKKVLTGIMLLSSMSFAATKVAILEEGDYYTLEQSINSTIAELEKKGKVVKNVSMSMASSKHGFKTIYYDACITYSDKE